MENFSKIAKIQSTKRIHCYFKEVIKWISKTFSLTFLHFERKMHYLYILSTLGWWKISWKRISMKLYWQILQKLYRDKTYWWLFFTGFTMCVITYNHLQKILETLRKLRKSCNHKRNINIICNQKLHSNCLQQLPTLRLSRLLKDLKL